MKKNIFTKSAFILFIFSFLIFNIETGAQQQLTAPQASQKASVTQRIGLTDITITYHRPGINNRKVWGELVPYNQVWRAGANENTTISFSDPVIIEGKEIPAGSYGLHMIPTEDDWTIIFSKNNWSWGSFFYDENEDAIRVNVKPISAEHKEWMEYTFDISSANQTIAALHWEELKIPFTIEVDVHNIVLNKFQNELDNVPGFFWQAWNQAANYALQNNVHIDEAFQWVERSIEINRNFTNLMTKSGLLELKGNNKEAADLRSEAVGMATENEMNSYGYMLVAAKKVDEAIEIFKKNVKDHPESWNVYDSLAEGYAIKGEKEKAIEYYSIALEKVNDDNNKTRITNTLANLKN